MLTNNYIADYQIIRSFCLLIVYNSIIFLV